MMLLSIIVPVYNVEKYLVRCLASLLRQGLKESEYEIICVNDGSPDNSASILAEYEIKYPNLFKVITQENKGLGAARNTGMAVAQGEYITFVDSDDYVIDNAYRFIYDQFCRDKRPDVVVYDNQWIYTNGSTLIDPDAKPEGKVMFEGNGAEAYNQYPMVCVWSKFYKRSFLQQHNIWSKVVVCQDELFNFDVFQNQPYTLIVNCRIYRYEQGNETSIQRTANKKSILVHLEQLFDNITIMTDYLQAGNTVIAPAAKRNINNFLNVYHRKILKTYIPWSLWRHYRKKMDALPTFHAQLKGSCRVARTVGWLQEMSGRSYIIYSIVCFLRIFVFTKCIKPLMIKKAK